MNKIIVISGGSSGLGKELVELYTKNGDTVINISRSFCSCATENIACDISSYDSVKSAVDTIKEKYDHIDILINNAGKGISGATELLEIDKIKEVMDTDYMGSLYLSRECLAIMKPKSKVVFISSACALFALPYRGVYCSAKSAMNMLSFTLKMELKRYGISVVSICPGDVKTEFTQNRIKLSATNEKYGDSPQKSADAIDCRNDKRMKKEKVAKKIYKIANKKKGDLYIIGAKYKVFYFWQKVLPIGVFNGIVNKIFNKK